MGKIFKGEVLKSGKVLRLEVIKKQKGLFKFKFSVFSFLLYKKYNI